MAQIDCEKIYCGKVFVASNYLMMLECKFCPEEFIPYEKFRKHIFDKHFDNIDQYKYESFEEDDITDLLKVEHNYQEEEHNTNQIENKNFTNSNVVISDGQSKEVSTTHREKNTHVSKVVHTKQNQPVDNPTNAVSIIRPQLKRNFVRYRKTKDRKYKCKTCDFASYARQYLKIHERRHTDNKPFACTLCTKTFFTRTELNTHIRWHTGERPFICPYCGKKFVTNGALNTHEKRHRNDRRFKCDQCDKSYYTSKMLMQHMTTHTGERNYKCQQCSNTFTREASLRNHMKLHENALRYECNLCQKRFNQKPTLIWHKKSQHGIVSGAGASSEKVDNYSGTDGIDPTANEESDENAIFDVEESNSKIMIDYLSI